MLALLASLLLTDCTAPQGTQALLARPERVIVVGEPHGTNEAPAAVAGLACQASATGPVTVALEYPETAQTLLDDFLIATDDVAANAILTSSDLFAATATDGRGSRAMLELLEAVRRLKRNGRDVAFHAFQPTGQPTPSLSQAWYELNMGHALARGVANRPEARVIALAGNLHARKTPHPLFDDQGLPAAGHLPGAETLTLNVAWQGGEAWDCRPDCGVHGGPGRVDPSLRGVILEPSSDGAYDGNLALGSTTASPPVGLGADSRFP